MKRLLLLLLIAASPTFAQTSLFSDDFNRSDEALDNSADWTKAGGGGGSELQVLSSGVALANAAGGRRAYTAPDQGISDAYVSSAVPSGLAGRSGTTNNQLAIRFSDTSNYIGLGIGQGGTAECGIRVAGSWTAYGTVYAADAVGLKIEAEGTTIRCYVDTGSGFGSPFHTESNVTTNQSETLVAYISNLNSPGTAVWDDFDTGNLSASSDWVTEIEEHFDVDHFASGTTYYFNPDSTSGNGSGTSNANAFYTCGQIDAKNFAAGDQLLAHEDKAVTCNVKVKNDSMVGTGTGNPFYFGVYHMSGGVETPGFSGGPYSNTPGGRPCFDGMDYDSYDYYGDMNNATLMAMIPTPNGGATFNDGTLEGVFNWYQASDYDLDLHIEGICVRASGGRAFRFTQTGNAVADYLLTENLYIEGTMTQGWHASGVNHFIFRDSFITKTDAEQAYQPSTTNTQACVAFKGTNNDPDTPVYGAFQRLVIWDSYCSEGVQSNSGGRHILIEDIVVADAGHVAGIYLDRTNDMTVRRVIAIHTDRTTFEMQTGALDWGGIVVQNEESCGSFDWCSTYNGEEDFAAYATQNAVIAQNLVIGWRYSYTFQSQASGKAGNTHTGEAHGACVYFYNNMSIDPDDRHFSINNPAPFDNYVLRTDCAPRVWGNAFINEGESGNVLVERVDAQFESVFNYNYVSDGISVGSAYDQNVTTSGITLPLSDYTDLSSYMSFDGDGWQDYDDIRGFLTAIGVNPDNVASRNLALFKPSANELSGLALSSMTYPSDTNSGAQDGLDIEGNSLPSSLYFGPFAGVVQDTFPDKPILYHLSRSEDR